MTGLNGATGDGEPVALPGLDPGNPLALKAGPTRALMTTEQQQTTIGPLLALTIRTPDVTLTVKLTRDDAAAWAQHIGGAAAGMSGLVVPPGTLS